MLEVFTEWTQVLQQCSSEQAAQIVKLKAGLCTADFDDKELQLTIGVMNEEKRGLGEGSSEEAEDSE